MSIFKISTLIPALFLTACSAVYSPVPMGEDTVNLDAQEWNGTWLGDDGIAVVEVTDAQNGEMKLTFVEAMNMDVTDVVVRSSGEWLFGSFRDEADEEDPLSKDKDVDGQTRFMWGRIELNGNTILIWEPDIARFRTLVEAGTLPGRVEEPEGFGDGNVYLGELTADHYRIITSGSEGVLLNWDEPQVLIRYKP